MPNLTLYDNKEETIELTENMDEKLKKSAYHDREKKVLILIIRDLKIEDSGNYTLIAKNGKQIKKEFSLNVEDNRKATDNTKGNKMELNLLIVIEHREQTQIINNLLYENKNRSFEILKIINNPLRKV